MHKSSMAKAFEVLPYGNLSPNSLGARICYFLFKQKQDDNFRWVARSEIIVNFDIKGLDENLGMLVQKRYIARNPNARGQYRWAANFQYPCKYIGSAGPAMVLPIPRKTEPRMNPKKESNEKKMTQQIMDELWAAGVRPSAASITESYRKAYEAFKFLGEQLNAMKDDLCA
jgi:hypothetical protein